MSDSNSVEVVQEKMAKNQSNKNKRKERQTTDGRVLADAFGLLSTEKQVRLLMVGLKSAGKATILRQIGNLYTTRFIDDDYETTYINNIHISKWDVGGQDKSPHLFQGTQGLVFVVDSADRDRVVEARNELHKLLKMDLLKDAVLLVFANKQDLPDAMNESQIIENLGLSSHLGRRQCRVVMTCATSREGIYEGLKWLSKKISYTLATTTVEGINKGLAWIAERKASYKKSKMVTCKVVESEDSKNAMAARRIADMERDVLEKYDMLSGHVAQIELIEGDLREEKMKRDSCLLELGAKTYLLVKKMKKQDRDESEF